VRNAVFPPETKTELRVLSELIHALKQDADDREQRFQERLDRLQSRVHALQTQTNQYWSATEKDVAALYLLTRKGEKP
jgi:predicted  nucleic acid-binding Zn-ribbon protein